jgi:hypothetical protein
MKRSADQEKRRRRQTLIAACSLVAIVTTVCALLFRLELLGGAVLQMKKLNGDLEVQNKKLVGTNDLLKGKKDEFEAEIAHKQEDVAIRDVRIQMQGMISAAQQILLQTTQRQLEDQGANLKSNQSKLNGMELQVAELSRVKAELELQQKALRDQVLRVQLVLSDRLDQYGQLAQLALLDRRARSEPLISKRESEIVLASFDSLQKIGSLTSAETKELTLSQLATLSKKAAVIIATLQNDFGQALDASTEALDSLKDRPDATPSSLANFHLLRGDIFLKRALPLVDSAEPSLQDLQQARVFLAVADSEYNDATTCCTADSAETCSIRLRRANVIRWHAKSMIANAKNEDRPSAFKELSAGITLVGEALTTFTRLSEPQQQTSAAFQSNANRMLGNLEYDLARLEYEGNEAARQKHVELAIGYYRRSSELNPAPNNFGTAKPGIDVVNTGFQIFTLANLSEVLTTEIKRRPNEKRESASADVLSRKAN